MMYVWIGVALAIIWALTALLRAWNSGKIAEENAEAAKAKAERAEKAQQERTARLKIKAEAKAKKHQAKLERKK